MLNMSQELVFAASAKYIFPFSSLYLDVCSGTALSPRDKHSLSCTSQLNSMTRSLKKRQVLACWSHHVRIN